MRCPDCTGPLVEKLKLGIHLDECADCHGIWFDFGELDSYRKTLAGLSDAPETVFVVDADQPKSSCPRCQKHELIVGDVGNYGLRKCNSCLGVFVPANTIAHFGPRSGTQVAGDVALESLAHGGIEILGDVVVWVIEGVFDSL